MRFSTRIFFSLTVVLGWAWVAHGVAVSKLDGRDEVQGAPAASGYRSVAYFVNWVSIISLIPMWNEVDKAP